MAKKKAAKLKENRLSDVVDNITEMLTAVKVDFDMHENLVILEGSVHTPLNVTTLKVRNMNGKYSEKKALNFTLKNYTYIGTNRRINMFHIQIRGNHFKRYKNSNINVGDHVIVRGQLGHDVGNDEYNNTKLDKKSTIINAVEIQNITNNINTKGIMLHDTMAFITAGVSLGLIDVQTWERDPKNYGKNKGRER